MLPKQPKDFDLHLVETFNQEIPRSLLRGYLAKGRGGRNRGVSPTMPFRLIPRSLLRGGFIGRRGAELRSLAFLYWQAHDTVGPFLHFHRNPDKEQVLNDASSWEALWYQEHSGACMLA